jgi:hypothetical protein
MAISAVYQGQSVRLAILGTPRASPPDAGRLLPSANDLRAGNVAIHGVSIAAELRQAGEAVSRAEAGAFPFPAAWLASRPGVYRT